MTPSVQRRRRRQSIVNQGIIQYRSCDLTSVVVEPFFFWQCGSILGYIGSVKIYGLFGKLSAQRDVVEISRKNSIISIARSNVLTQVRWKLITIVIKLRRYFLWSVKKQRINDHNYYLLLILATSKPDLIYYNCLCNGF